MKACIGKDLTGEIAKSQAFLVFKSSYEFNTTASVASADAVAVAVEVAEDEDLLVPVPDAFPYR